MPLVKVDMKKGQSLEYKQAIMTGIHQAMVSTFKIKANDHMIRIREYEQENFKTIDYMSDKAVFIEMIVFPGRTKETKEKLFQEVVKNLSKSPGIDPLDIFIVLQEPPQDNWGIRGGQQASSLELGFKTDV